MTTVVFAPTAGVGTGTVTVAAGIPKAIHLVPSSGQQLNPYAEAALFYRSGTDLVWKEVIPNEGLVITVEGSYEVSKQPGATFGITSEP